jgi:hypothetical protein
MPPHQRFRLDNRYDLQDRWKPSIHLDEEPAVAVGRLNSTPHPAPQDDQLVSEHRILRLKPALRLERRGQHGQNKRDKRDRRANLADSSLNKPGYGFRYTQRLKASLSASTRRRKPTRPLTSPTAKDASSPGEKGSRRSVSIAPPWRDAGSTAVPRPVKNAPAGGSALAETPRGSVHESPVRHLPHARQRSLSSRKLDFFPCLCLRVINSDAKPGKALLELFRTRLGSVPGRKLGFQPAINFEGVT